MGSTGLDGSYKLHFPGKPTIFPNIVLFKNRIRFPPGFLEVFQKDSDPWFGPPLDFGTTSASRQAFYEVQRLLHDHLPGAQILAEAVDPQTEDQRLGLVRERTRARRARELARGLSRGTRRRGVEGVSVG